jgi:hypothetical protein
MKNQKETAARGKNEVIFPVYSLLLKNGATGDQFAGTASTTRESARPGMISSAALSLRNVEDSHSSPVRPCQGSGPGSRPAATSASRSR